MPVKTSLKLALTLVVALASGSATAARNSAAEPMFGGWYTQLLCNWFGACGNVRPNGDDGDGDWTGGNGRG